MFNNTILKLSFKFFFFFFFFLFFFFFFFFLNVFLNFLNININNIIKIFVLLFMNLLRVINLWFIIMSILLIYFMIKSY